MVCEQDSGGALGVIVNVNAISGSLVSPQRNDFDGNHLEVIMDHLQRKNTTLRGREGMRISRGGATGF